MHCSCYICVHHDHCTHARVRVCLCIRAAHEVRPGDLGVIASIGDSVTVLYNTYGQLLCRPFSSYSPERNMNCNVIRKHILIYKTTLSKMHFLITILNNVMLI